MLAVHRPTRPLLPELSGLLAGLPNLTALRPFFGVHPMRLEDTRKDGLYEVRAELPGVDPAEDIEVIVRDGRLTIRAERAQADEATGRSEFRYGSFARTVELPAGADEDDITAVYDRGILTVAVPVVDDEPGEIRVEIIETILVDEEDFDDDFADEDDEDEDAVTVSAGAGAAFALEDGAEQARSEN